VPVYRGTPVTEIPEHLLKRSRERRSQLTGKPAEGAEPAADTAGAEPASPVPATTAAATPAAPAIGPSSRVAGADPPAAPALKPDSPVVAAAKRRTKIPFWAMAGLSLMPLWGFMYVRALTEPPEVAEDPLSIGAEVFAGVCSSCHQADGAGGSAARQLSDGEVLKTFPNIEDQIRFVYWGTQAYQNAGVTIYGDPNREGGPNETGSLNVMPPQGEMAGGERTDVEILSVVCEERYTIGGADPESDEYAEEFEQWCAEESPIFAALEAEETTLFELADAGIVDVDGNPVEIIPIGEEPIAGSSG